MPQINLETEVQRLEDYYTLRNLIGRFSYKETALLSQDLFALFAEQATDVRIEVAGRGVWEGKVSVGRFLSRLDKVDHEGLMIVNAMTTSVIEVATDGQTAKGLWTSPGNETSPSPGVAPDGFWTWSRLGVDFIRENSDWKIWHMVIFPIVKWRPMKNWAEENAAATSPLLADQVPADRPSLRRSVYNPANNDRSGLVLPEANSSFNPIAAY